MLKQRTYRKIIAVSPTEHEGGEEKYAAFSY